MKTEPTDAAFSNAIDLYGNPSLGSGLTKREYFAAMAIMGKSDRQGFPAEGVAKSAVAMADALIAELSK